MNPKFKISAIILASFYFLLSLGFGISHHYCHGEYSSTSIIISNPGCGCEKGDAEMTCCSTINQFIQLDEDFVLNQNDKKDLSVDLIFITLSEQENLDYENLFEIDITDDFIDSGPPKYIMHHSLVLYA